MTEEALKEAFKLGEEDLEEKPQEEAQEEASTEEQSDSPSPIEVEARDMGHVSKDEWVSSGRDPDEWVSPYEYVRYGKLQRSMHNKLDQQDREYKKRFDNLNKYHEAQRKIEIDTLKSQQRAAAENADVDEFDRLQAKIDNVQSQPVETADSTEDGATAGKSPEIVQWEQSNPWIYDPVDNRTILANAKYQQFQATNPDASPADALRYVDNELAKAFPKQNPRRAVAATAETSARQPSGPKKLSMSDLTDDERNIWANGGTSLFGGDKEKFLQAVQDSRA
jgi:hypothetical protein